MPYANSGGIAPTYSITPHWMVFVSRNWFLCCLSLAGLAVSLTKPEPLSNPLLWIATIVAIAMAYQFIAVRVTEYEITPDQIRINTGVFNRDIDHIELYRVFDYKTRKPFLMRLFGLENIRIYSGDRTMPVLLIPGVRQKANLVAIIRQRVEYQKQIKHIYEICNK